MTESIPYSSVDVNDRFREDLQDIDGLAESIARFGLIQPMLITDTTPPVLVAGGRRYTALGKLQLTTLVHGVHYIHPREITEIQRREMELEENVQRADMTWQEKAISIYEIHALRRRRAIESSEDDWITEKTGELLGVSASSVKHALKIAEALKSGDAEVAKCQSARDVLMLLLKRAKDNAATRLSTLLRANPTSQPTTGSTSIAAAYAAMRELDLAPKSPKEPITAEEAYLRHVTASPTYQSTIDEGVSTVEVPPYVTDGNMIRGECLSVLSTFPDESVDHIITDPPYGIDMEMLDQDGDVGMAGIDSVAATHDVTDNLMLFSEMIPEFFRVLKPTGFCVVWCDVMNWMNLYNHATRAGFRVQRWPLTWVKTHVCKNGSAGFNWTKTTEIAMVMAKKNARLIAPQHRCEFACKNDEFRDVSGHPFSKPIALWQWIIKAIVLDGGSFLDPFAGRGSAIIAGLRCNRVPYGIEMDPTHFDHLINNISKEKST